METLKYLKLTPIFFWNIIIFIIFTHWFCSEHTTVHSKRAIMYLQRPFIHFLRLLYLAYYRFLKCSLLFSSFFVSSIFCLSKGQGNIQDCKPPHWQQNKSFHKNTRQWASQFSRSGAISFSGICVMQLGLLASTLEDKTSSDYSRNSQ